MEENQKEHFRNLFANKIKNGHNGMCVSLAGCVSEFTFPIGLLEENDTYHIVNYGAGSQIELWIHFIFDLRESSGCRVVVERSYVPPTPSEHIMTFTLGDTKTKIPTKHPYHQILKEIIQYINDSYNELEIK